VQELKDKLSELLEENPEAPEAQSWKQALAEMGESIRALGLTGAHGRLANFMVNGVFFRKHPGVSCAFGFPLNISESFFFL
jgi:hypothetical protein